MDTSCNKLQLIHYTDDTTAFISGNCSDELLSNNQMESMHVWLQINKLTLIISKSSYTIHRYYNLSPNICKTIQTQFLNETINITFVGITNEEKLKYKIHINKARRPRIRSSFVSVTEKNEKKKKIFFFA